MRLAKLGFSTSILAAFFAVAGCRNEPYCFNCVDGGTVNRDVRSAEVEPVDGVAPDGADATPDRVVADIVCMAGAPELCNGADDNCDGRTDEGFDLATNAGNCGACGNACALPHALPSCAGGMCVVPTNGCDVNWWNINGVNTDGCEYMCTAVPGATNDATCDGRDDNCNGQTDENVDLCTSLTSCGACGTACVYQHAVAMCIHTGTAACNATNTACQMGACANGYINLNNNSADGCEYPCVPSGGPEICNLRDDDCNGLTDDGLPTLGPCGLSVGACTPGTLQCVGGTVQCFGGTSPSVEICNNIDDDCNGVTDDGFNFQLDPRNCGSCGNNCLALPNAVTACQSATCQIVACNIGFYNLDGNMANGCEYACSFASSIEICNGADDNCNGTTDEGVAPPAGFCRTSGLCAGSTASCSGATGFQCNYPAAVQVDPMTGQPVAVETLCDGQDNNCNGATDEPYANLGLTCTSGGLGTCGSTGMYVCNAAMNGTVCNAPPPGTGGAEICDGLDNDCDGSTDETALTPGTNASFVSTAWVSFAANLWIMQYEASRPSASLTDAGFLTNRACSAASVMPWTNLTAPQAAAACAAAGARLCTEAEWQQACVSSTGTCTWGYSAACTTYSATACNGVDNDIDPLTPGIQNGLLATGRLASCRAVQASASAFDMSGNVKEFTTGATTGTYPVRGGSYNNLAFGTTCTYNWTAVDAMFAFPNAGFRCCYSGATPP